MPFKTLPTIQIGGHTFKIELKDASTVDGDNRWGETRLEKNEILVATKARDGECRPISSIEQCLLHELAHAVSQIYNADLSEGQTVQMSEGLYQVLKQYGLKLIEQVEDLRG
jgi:hypothetical protein